MSFILDALRKSENKRRNQHDNIGQTLYEASTQAPPKSRLWVIVLGFVLLFNLLLILWMVNVWQRPSPEPEIVQVSVPAPIAPATVAVEPVTIAQPETLEAPSAPPETTPVIDSPVAESYVPVATVLPEDVPIQEEPPAVVEPVSAPRLYAVSELPPNLRSRVSALQMAMHAYNANNPTASMVQIDGRLLRAGGQIADDLRIEEITAEGVVLHSGIYRFLLPRRGQ